MMTIRILDTVYRGVEFGTHRDEQGDWHWTYYPKIGAGVAKRGKAKRTRETAVAACKVAIDEWLGP
jgi:hypothetical protein